MDWDAPSIPALATTIAAGTGATSLATGPDLPPELKALVPAVSDVQRLVVAQGYRTGLAAGFSQPPAQPIEMADVQDLVRSLASGPHDPLLRLGCAFALLGTFAWKKAAARSGSTLLKVGTDAAYTTSKVVTGIASHDVTVVNAALAFGSVAAHALETARPKVTTAVEAAQAGVDLYLGHPDAFAVLTDVAALQLVVTGAPGGSAG